MKTRTLLTAAAALALLFTGNAAEAGYIRGRLTILHNSFILKLDAPFEHDVSEAQDGSEILTVDRTHVIPSEERRAELRAFVGKYVRTLGGELVPAHTAYHHAPLLLLYDENCEPFEEINPPEADK